MSERIYALLLRLYPSSFRAVYGDEALLLFRDRASNERGLIGKLRLWMDIFTDAIISLPKEYGRPEAEIVRSSVDRTQGAIQLGGLCSGAPPASAIFCGGLVSLVLFGTLFVWVGQGRNYRLAHALPGPTKASLHAAMFSHHVQSTLPQGEISAIGKAESAHLLHVSIGITGGGRGFSSTQAAEGSGQSHSATQAAQPKVQDASAAIIEALDKHGIVMFGEAHGNKQEYEWLCKLVESDQFADHVDDIVVEFGNSLYQKSVDRYIAGEDVPMDRVEKAWRNVVGSFGPPSPVYEWFYKAVRESNLKRRGHHQIRLLLGDPYADWDNVKSAEDLGPFMANREQWYVQVVKDEVLAKKHRALLIMGEGHFLRRHGAGYIEQQLRAVGADPYVVVFGTDAVGSYDELDARFEGWNFPAIVSLSDNWVGELPAMPVTSGGMAGPTALKLSEAADALLYAGPRDELTEVNMPGSELTGSAYGKELARRILIETGQTLEFNQPAEDPQFHRPHPPTAGGAPHVMPPPPKSIHDPLPPRPPSQ
jgi:hypothetical protein